MSPENKENDEPIININANPSGTLEIVEFLHTMKLEKGDEQKINRVNDDKEKSGDEV